MKYGPPIFFAHGKLAARFKRAVLAIVLLLWAPGGTCPARQDQEESRLSLTSYTDPASGTELRLGTFRVYENRASQRGRTIDLNIVVLPALGPEPAPDPIFMLAGGPGQAATSFAAGSAKSWMRGERDIVLVDQRGTGRSNPLRVPLAGSDDNLQGYLDPIFQEEIFRAALKDLEKKADLTQYTTPVAMDDLNEVRAALGYEKINLMGGSYGSRAALVYLRRHPKTVRCAVLNGIAPISFTNPLYHARSAQAGLELIFAECKSSHARRKVFGDLDRKFRTILKRLEKKPAEVTISHPVTTKNVTVQLTREAFGEALRVMMYYMDTNRLVPSCILRAYEGDFRPFAQRGLESNRRLRNMLCFGMLMSVVGSEDIPRIDPDSIPRETRGTFLGDGRVRRQAAIAAFWPCGDIPPEYGEPVRSDVPVLLLSGTHDPVTPPRFGEEAARHLKNSLHLIVPGAHGVGGPVIDAIVKDFLNRGTTKGLDTSKIKEIHLPPFKLLEGNR